MNQIKNGTVLLYQCRFYVKGEGLQYITNLYYSPIAAATAADRRL